MFTASMIIFGGLRGYMVIEELLDLRLELLDIDYFLITELHRPPQFAELLPVALSARRSSHR